MAGRGHTAVSSPADTTDQLMQVAAWYYVHGWSQARIAKTIGLDPSTVSRYLKRARDDGFVHIEIRRPPTQRTDLGRAVADLYGLSRVIVVSTDGDAMESVAAAAAEHVDGLLRSGMRLGISWGRTLAAVVRHFRPGSVSGLTISQLAGGIDESSPGIQGHDLVRMVAALYPDSQTQ
jgi:deoxyribonucleoside regulator